MKKIIYAILSLALCGAFALLGACGGSENGESNSAQTSSVSSETESSSVTIPDSEETESTEDEHNTLVYNAEISEYFGSSANGNTLYVNMKARVYTSGFLSGTLIGSAGMTEMVVDGGEDGADLVATGEGIGAIKGANGATLVFKNLCIKDTSAAGTSLDGERREGYLEFGGKLRFENCEFSCAAYFCDDTDAEFINCTFNSGAENMYAAWVSDGSVSFKDCVFKGWRAIKLYEGSDNKYTSVQPQFDVVNVVIDGCRFENLKKKPGIAIDVFQGKETSITIKNCDFDGCQNGDGVDYIDGVYESDVDTSTLTFFMENNKVDGNDCFWEDRIH